MFDVLEKESLNANVTRMTIAAPLIARKAQAGQFVIVRACGQSERIPLTIADSDADAGTIRIIYQIVGAGTMELDTLKTGQELCDLAGPLGKATETDGLRRVCVVGGGVGCAIAYPVAKKLYQQGAAVYSIIGFRHKDAVILQDAFEKVSAQSVLMTDDGSAGEKGFVTHALKRLILEGNPLDHVFAVGPLVMMKSVCEITKQYGIPTTVSMNPIMIDGTGMCGGCRLTVGGETRFACVDGPDFDGHLVDFDEVIRRNRMYSAFEQTRREETCRLFQKEC